MRTRLGRDTLTLRARASSGLDDYGNDTWTSIDYQVAGCRVIPRVSTEGTGDDSAQIITGLWAYAPTDRDFTAVDAVIWGGDTYEVDGEPGVWRTPTGSIAYQQVALKRVTG